MITRLFFLSLVLASMAVSGCVTNGFESAQEDPNGPEEVDFKTEVKPILEARCVMCHNAETLPNQPSFETAKLAMKGDPEGPIIIPGDPDGSRLIVAAVLPQVHEKAMPPVSSRITEDEIEVLKQWIREGADWPKGDEGRITPAFIPLE